MARALLFVCGFAVGLALSCGSSAPSACDPTFCQGCCDAQGRCATGEDVAACGKRGAACVACEAQQTCTATGCAAAGGASGGSGGGTGGFGGFGDAGSGGGTGSFGGAGGSPDAGDKAANCASVFGSALTNAFGRLDGTVTAVVTPADTQCTLPNSDHVVVQVSMNGAIYRMVVNVLSTFGSPDVSYRTLDSALVGGPWQEGWHTGLTLDYPSTLGVHSDAGFAAVPMATLVPLMAGEIDVGAKISVFASSSGGVNASSTHLIHRNGASNDGALVVHPDGAAPRWLLFHFPQQSF